MITADPDITRLLNRLKALKLVRQRRDRHDRRVVWTQISEAGMQLLDSMDPVVLRAPREMLGHMSPEELDTMSHLLELARANCIVPEQQNGAGSAHRPEEAAAVSIQPDQLTQ